MPVEIPSEKESSNLLDRLPPCDLDAERAVLGVMLAYEDAQAFALDNLVVEDFYGFGHDKVFKAMKQLYERGDKINPATVGHEMKKHDWLQEIGGNLHLMDMADSSIRHIGGRFLELIKIVSKLGMKRRFIIPLSLALNDCYAMDKTPNAIVDSVQQGIYEILRVTKTGDPISLRQIFRNEAEFIQEVIAGKTLPGILTGFQKFDHHIGSLFPGDLFVLAGVPGSGKTIFASCIGLNAATLYEKRVLFISMEMYEKKFAPRLISNQAGVPHRVARLRDYRGENVRYLEHIHIKSKQVTDKFHAFMEGPLTPLEIRTKAKKHAIVHGLDLLIVDHLHEMKSINPRDTRYDRATYGAEIMKETGMELKVPTILLSQLSRELNYRNDPRPRMSDLRDSGNIEAKADLIGMIFRPGMYDQSNSTDMELGLVKYRDDEKKIFKFRMNGSFMKYEESNDEPTTGNYGGDSTPF